MAVEARVSESEPQTKVEVTLTADGIPQIAPVQTPVEKLFTTTLSHSEEIETVLGCLAEGPEVNLYQLDQDQLRRSLLGVNLDAGPITIKALPKKASEAIKIVRYSPDPSSDRFSKGVGFDFAFNHQRRLEFNGRSLSFGDINEINRVVMGPEYRMFEGGLERSLRSTITEGLSEEIEQAIEDVRGKLMDSVRMLLYEQVARYHLNDEQGAEAVGRVLSYPLEGVFPTGYLTGEHFPGELVFAKLHS